MLNNKVSKAVRLAIAFGAVSSAAFSANTFAAENEENAEGVERIQVTGSRIKRVDLQGPSPVQVFDKVAIEAAGTESVADFLLKSNLAGPGIDTADDTLSSGGGTASFATKGLGASYTVILVNGNRLPGTPTGGSASADVNQIPMAAVERIEYLADGASAIYGADAVAGVINIITKKDFEGVNMSAQYGQSAEGDAGTTSLQFVGGVSTEKGNVMFAADFYKRQTVMATERPLIGSAISPSGKDGRSPTGMPGTWIEEDFSTAYPVAGCPESNIRPTTVVDNGFECSYDFATLYQAFPYLEKFNLFSRGEFNLTDDLSIWAEGRSSRTLTEVRNGAAPAPFTKVLADNPENPYGRDMYIIRRTVEAGPRSRDITNSSVGFTTGFEYSLSDDIYLDGKFQKNWSRQSQVGLSGNISRKGLTEAIASGDIKLTTENTFEAFEAVSVPTHRQGEFQETIIGLGLSGMLPFELGEEQVGFAFGMESRDENYFDVTDIAQQEGDIAGGAASNGRGSKETDSYFLELNARPIEMVEFSAAVRNDSIKTTLADLGSETTYKLAVSVRPTDTLLLRTSYGTGFKSPTLGNLYLDESFGVGRGIDPKACAEDKTQCTQREIRSVSGGNPELKPETSTSIGLGMSWDVDFVEGLSVTADYWNFKVEGKIGSLGLQEILNNEDKYPQLVNRIGGRISHPDAFVRSNLQNLSEQNGTGIDYNVNYLFDTAMGSANIGVRATQLLSSERQSSAIQPLCEDKGTTSEAEWSSSFYANLTTDNWGANINVRYVGETVDHEGGYKSGTCEWNNPDTRHEVDSYMQVDLSGHYYITESVKFSAGIRNLFDEEPPFSTVAGGGWPWYDQALYDNMGRFYYSKIELNF
jgi:iron complex outermembrane receptor protein